MSTPGLSAGELALIRADLAVAYAGSGTIQTRTTVSDGQGGQTQTHAATGTALCHLSPDTTRGGEPIIAGREAEMTAWILTCAGTVTLNETDRVVVSGQTYEVLEVLAPRTWQLNQRVRLMEVD